MSETVRLAPSILAADFARLGDQVVEAERAGADRIHIDVMDGHFVPNLSMGAAVVESLRRVTDLPLETHLMVSNPDAFLDEFAAAGADSFLVHWEGNNNLHRTVQRIRALGKGAGVAINPATPAAALEEVLQDVDQVLVMTVDPGFGHQHFLPTTVAKIARVRELVERIKPGAISRWTGHRRGDRAAGRPGRRHGARGGLRDLRRTRRRRCRDGTAAPGDEPQRERDGVGRAIVSEGAWKDASRYRDRSWRVPPETGPDHAPARRRTRSCRLRRGCVEPGRRLSGLRHSTLARAVAAGTLERGSRSAGAVWASRSRPTRSRACAPGSWPIITLPPRASRTTT